MNYKVLIVDNSKLARTSITKTLGALRPTWKLLETADANDALALIARSGADITLLDVNLPGTDGLTVASDARKLRPSMPLALLSGSTQEKLVEAARSLGATFLAKPCSTSTLSDFLSGAEQTLRARALR